MGLWRSDGKGTAGGLFRLKLRKFHPKEVAGLQAALFLLREWDSSAVVLKAKYFPPTWTHTSPN